MSEVEELKNTLNVLSGIILDIMPHSYYLQNKDLTYTCEICNKSALKCCSKILSPEETIIMTNSIKYDYKGIEREHDYHNKWMMSKCGRILHAKCNLYYPVALDSTRCMYCVTHNLDCRDSKKQKLSHIKGLL